MSMVMALPPALAASVNNPAMIRAAHPHEIRLLPQIENVADGRFASLHIDLSCCPITKAMTCTPAFSVLNYSHASGLR